jgi:threonylcarbamoyladenosine tRNA methylthiotransferase MtaB
VEAILGDIASAVRGGAQEVVLTGVHLGSWGQDFTPATHLSQLVQTVLQRSGAARLRLSSLEPWDLDAEFFSLWEDPRLCRHLHLPLQSGSAATLRRMARKTTPESFARLVAAAREAVPDMAITTDIIVGFPGETETEFQESLDTVRGMRFAGGHVFTYSPRAGTAAARMPGQVPPALRKERSAQVRAALSEASLAYQAGHIGQVLPVLWESATAVGPQGWRLSGLTDNYLRVQAEAGQEYWNHITPVLITSRGEQGLAGSVHGSLHLL